MTSELAQIVVYDDTGRIVRASTLQKRVIERKREQIADGHTSKVVPIDKAIADPESFYVDDSGSIVDRSTMAVSVSTSQGSATLSNLPDPCTVTWAGQSAEATGGEATVTFDEPGDYTLRLTAEPKHWPHELTVTIP